MTVELTVHILCLGNQEYDMGQRHREGLFKVSVANSGLRLCVKKCKRGKFHQNAKMAYLISVSQGHTSKCLNCTAICKNKVQLEPNPGNIGAAVVKTWPVSFQDVWLAIQLFNMVSPKNLKDLSPKHLQQCRAMVLHYVRQLLTRTLDVHEFIV